MVAYSFIHAAVFEVMVVFFNFVTSAEEVILDVGGGSVPPLKFISRNSTFFVRSLFCDAKTSWTPSWLALLLISHVLIGVPSV
jgi:hypothetical protein